MKYPRFITHNWKPYDVVEVTELTRKIVCRKIGGVEERKYTSFYVAGVYRGIVTGCVVGCNLRCFFCWSPISRDFPEFYGKYYSPEKAVNEMAKLARKSGVRKARLSCGEPTICWSHLLGVLELIEESPYFDLFILETNGIVLGLNPGLISELKKFSKLYVRVSIKGGTSEGFEFRTGAQGNALNLQFSAVKALAKSNIRFHVAAMTDSRVMSKREKNMLIEKLRGIEPTLAFLLEEENVDPYDTTLLRLKAANVKLNW